MENIEIDQKNLDQKELEAQYMLDTKEIEGFENGLSVGNMLGVFFVICFLIFVGYLLFNYGQLWELRNHTSIVQCSILK